MLGGGGWMTVPLPDVTGEPSTGLAIGGELRRVHAESEAYWGGWTTAAFFAPLGTSWSPADHVRHLTKAMRPVAAALRAPRWALRIAFGRPRRASRAFGKLRADYHGVLAAGGKAERYAPKPLTPDAVGEAARSRIMARHAAAVEALVRRAGRRSERALDRHQLPHPLLGRLTVREMLYFMLYHNVHHVHVAERRRREQSP